MRVLVSGGAGFIGSHVVPKLLETGVSVRILDSLSPQIHGAIPCGLEWMGQSGVEFLRGNVMEPADWERALRDIDVVIHLAAETGTGQSMYEVARYNAVNSHGTALLFDVLGRMKGHRVRRVILSSSRSIYGEGAYICSRCDAGRVFPGARSARQLELAAWEPACSSCGQALSMVPTKESDPPFPASIYAATKCAQEDLVRIACEAARIDYAILRLQNVYGEGQSLNNPYTGILSIFSTRVRRGLFLPLFEDGEETRDFVHVDDVARAMLLAVQHEGDIRTTINVGSGIATSVKIVADELTKAFDQEPDLRVTGQYRLGDIRHNCADIGRLEAVLGMKPSIELAEGMRRFANWVNQQPLPEDRLEQANQELRDRKLMN